MWSYAYFDLLSPTPSTCMYKSRGTISCALYMAIVYYSLQLEPSSEARSAGGCGGSGWSWQVLPHPGTAWRDGETWRKCLPKGLLITIYAI